MLSIGDKGDGMSDFGAIRAIAAYSGMKILLDECVPWPMHKLLEGHDCTTAQRRGWGGLSNGDLLRQAEGEFDVFITSDQNLRYQQNLMGRRIIILELATNKLRRIQAAAPQILNTIAELKTGEFRHLDIP